MALELAGLTHSFPGVAPDCPDWAPDCGAMFLTPRLCSLCSGINLLYIELKFENQEG